MRNGFTLIELLIVIAILAILATFVTVLINPPERFAESRDAGRISGVVQLGHAVDAYNTTFEVYPDPTQWDTDLVATGYPASFPAGIDYNLSGSSPCSTNSRPSTKATYCYTFDSANGVLIFARMESQKKRDQCNLIGQTYFVYSTADERAGVICDSSDPTPWVQGTKTYLY